MCHDSNENGDHVFVNCRKALEVQNAVNRWRRLLPMNCSNVTEFWEAFCDDNQTATDKSLTELTKQAYFWAIWNSRNEAIFNNKPFNPLGVANVILSSMYLWCISRGKLNRCRDRFN